MDDGSVKPGWKTSEFWLHVAAQVPTVLGLFLGASNPAVIGVTIAVNLAAAAYSACRAHVKTTALIAAMQPVAQTATEALKKATADSQGAQ